MRNLCTAAHSPLGQNRGERRCHHCYFIHVIRKASYEGLTVISKKDQNGRDHQKSQQTHMKLVSFVNLACKMFIFRII